ncbi:MAG: hypothetical protein ACOX5W_01910 [Bacillota bacterium]|jgi:hypothetical protein
MSSKLDDFLTPAQVCQVLKVTPNQVRQLIQDGWLEVARTTKYKHGAMELFYQHQVCALRSDMPKIRRGWESLVNHRLGASKAAAAREANRHVAVALKRRKEQFLESLDELSERTGNTLRVCFFLYHLNHYAKNGHTYLYELKERVLRKLWTEYCPQELLNVTFVQGGPRVRLCPGCRFLARQQRKSYLEYLRTNGGCPKCTRDEQYYSLYEFTVAYGEYRFCFHIPYSVARKWLVNPADIPIKESALEREGFYVYGRSIFEPEAMAFEMLEVVREIEQFLLL